MCGGDRGRILAEVIEEGDRIVKDREENEGRVGVL